MPPERILPECGHSAFQARARRVIESRKITTSRPYSTIRLAFSMTISLTCTWRAEVSSNVRADDLAVGAFDLPLHVGDFFRPLVDEQHDDVGVRDSS